MIAESVFVRTCALKMAVFNCQLFTAVAVATSL